MSNKQPQSITIRQITEALTPEERFGEAEWNSAAYALAEQMAIQSDTKVGDLFDQAVSEWQIDRRNDEACILNIRRNEDD